MVLNPPVSLVSNKNYFRIRATLCSVNIQLKCSKINNAIMLICSINVNNVAGSGRRRRSLKWQQYKKQVCGSLETGHGKRILRKSLHQYEVPPYYHRFPLELNLQ